MGLLPNQHDNFSQNLYAIIKITVKKNMQLYDILWNRLNSIKEIIEFNQQKLKTNKN